MDRGKYNSKDVFRLRIRIGLLIVLVVFILGFLFLPEWEVEKDIVDPIDSVIVIIPAPPDEIVDIVEIPKTDLGDKLDEEIDKEEEKDKDIPKTDNDFNRDKEASIKIRVPRFFHYDAPPKPLNLDKVKFECPRHLEHLGIEGTVKLLLLIDVEGNVKEVKIDKGLFDSLDEFIAERAWKLKFSPAMHGDKPVEVYYSFPVTFIRK